jgi:hypothetical protein
VHSDNASHAGVDGLEHGRLEAQRPGLRAGADRCRVETAIRPSPCQFVRAYRRKARPVSNGMTILPLITFNCPQDISSGQNIIPREEPQAL